VPPPASNTTTSCTALPVARSQARAADTGSAIRSTCVKPAARAASRRTPSSTGPNSAGRVSTTPEGGWPPKPGTSAPTRARKPANRSVSSRCGATRNPFGRTTASCSRRFSTSTTAAGSSSSIASAGAPQTEGVAADGT
jgi:hypothetical protein